MAYPEPPASKGAVTRAGQAIAKKNANHSDLAIVDQWRAAHGYVINTFQAWIKGHINKKNYYIEFAQRLKRRNTVIDKLQRTDGNGNLLIKDVAAMHDFAGCRMIFDDIDQLNDFRDYIHSSIVMRNVEHVLRHAPNKYITFQTQNSQDTGVSMMSTSIFLGVQNVSNLKNLGTDC